MICEHECPICGEEYNHLCDSSPKEPLGLIMILTYNIEYMPKCDREDYFLECSGCRLNKEFLK